MAGGAEPVVGGAGFGLRGVITGWHGPRLEELRGVLAMPEDPLLQLVATIPLGMPVGGHGPVRRRPLGEVVYEDGWEQWALWAVDPAGTRFTSAGPPAKTRR